MNVGSLFSGAGLMDWGLTLAGFDHAWFCESDPYCRRILERRWPGLPVYDDVRELDAAPAVDVLSGGFPCQPVSLVGRRQAQDDARWLWPHFERLVRVLRPRYVLVENVPGLLTAGMGDVLGGLAACGYDAEWDCIRAADVGAPHIRERVFLLAYPGSTRRREDAGGAPGNEGENAGRASNHDHVANGDGQGGGAQVMADSVGFGRRAGQRDVLPPHREPDASRCGEALADTDCQPLVWASVARPERAPWSPEPGVGRMAYGVPARVDRLRALGNGVVPQVAQWIGERILEAERVTLAGQNIGNSS